MKRNLVLIVVLGFLNLTAHAAEPIKFFNFKTISWYALYERSLVMQSELYIYVQKKDILETEFRLSGYCNWLLGDCNYIEHLYMDNSTGVVSKLCGSEKVSVGIVKDDLFEVKLWNCYLGAPDGNLELRSLPNGQMMVRVNTINRRFGTHPNCYSEMNLNRIEPEN